MRKIVMIVFLVLAFFPGSSKAQSEQTPPEGMEYVQISPGYKILVPKGTKMTKIGEGSIKPEDINLYVGRKFTEQEQKISQLGDENRELRGMLEELRKEINDLKAKSN